MVKTSVIAKTLKDVASNHKLNTKQIDALIKTFGVKELLVNPLVCNRCGKRSSVVGRYMTCDPCEAELGRADKEFLMETKIQPMFEDEFLEFQHILADNEVVTE